MQCGGVWVPCSGSLAHPRATASQLIPAAASPCCCPQPLLLPPTPADMRPVRSAVMSGILQQFVRAFFDENPLSQLGLVVMRDGVAERLTELSSSPVGGWEGGRVGRRVGAWVGGLAPQSPAGKASWGGEKCTMQTGAIHPLPWRLDWTAINCQPCSQLPSHLLQDAHIAKLRQALDTGGDASLQNALDLAVDSLKSIPPYGHR